MGESIGTAGATSPEFKMLKKALNGGYRKRDLSNRTGKVARIDGKRLGNTVKESIPRGFKRATERPKVRWRTEFYNSVALIGCKKQSNMKTTVEAAYHQWHDQLMTIAIDWVPDP